MRPTSHFIGISLDASKFVDLFVALQKYCSEHDLFQAVELQNPLSTHITLHYLPTTLLNNEQVQIIQDTAEQILPTVTHLQIGYFGEPANERICYLACAPDQSLDNAHQFFATRYPHDDVPDNQLTFVPHISLFRISNPQTYAAHRRAIDKLVTLEISQITTCDLVTGIHLYQVSSRFHPEIQLVTSAWSTMTTGYDHDLTI